MSYLATAAAASAVAQVSFLATIPLVVALFLLAIIVLATEDIQTFRDLSREELILGWEAQNEMREALASLIRECEESNLLDAPHWQEEEEVIEISSSQEQYRLLLEDLLTEVEIQDRRLTVLEDEVRVLEALVIETRERNASLSTLVGMQVHPGQGGKAINLMASYLDVGGIGGVRGRTKGVVLQEIREALASLLS